MNRKTKKLLACLALPLAVGGLAALVTFQGMEAFENLNQPPLSPPGWLFPVVWTALYLAMGWASFRILVSDRPKAARKGALTLYALQLGVNFLWPVLFFGLAWYLVSFFWLIFLWVLVLVTMLRFSRVDSLAGDLLFPYLLWSTFALYLNFGIYVLNK